ncbi:MAG: hypothetical protein FJ104_17320, partial [Deltaproteobacteria bacterium]|nr:hypothetical protein [Deltaproteobacteria bacterium]
ILVPRWSSDAAAPVEDVTRTPAFAATRAVAEGRVFAVDARDLTSESPAGVRGVEVLAARLHQLETAT